MEMQEIDPSESMNASLRENVADRARSNSSAGPDSVVIDVSNYPAGGASSQR